MKRSIIGYGVWMNLIKPANVRLAVLNKHQPQIIAWRLAGNHAARPGGLSDILHPTHGSRRVSVAFVYLVLNSLSIVAG